MFKAYQIIGTAQCDCGCKGSIRKRMAVNNRATYEVICPKCQKRGVGFSVEKAIERWK